ncbi:hypothetical protein CB0940_11370 [Cercospora beticola]|uniref:Uncharacterized protein n=1 Tax=Cercospora beticola TaxID=122368 RepID=A0A2G5HDR0_CERBT|nr:hypothetical protein CB0940_11370 [Cercospora beticola]PIA90687.1 hypothetical protein CB0940_11370 [Cercospora beticola]WPB08215.1 hypothetical protein RHO25_012880 [Cercospora beticola]
MQAPTWNLKRRLEVLDLRDIDRVKLSAQEPRKRNITILNWGKSIRADGKTLFAIARAPFLGGDTGFERKKTAVKAWLSQHEAVQDYFVACSAQVISGNLDAIFEVLDLYGGPCFKAQLPVPEEARRSHQKQQKQTSTPVAAQQAQTSASAAPMTLAQMVREMKQGEKKCTVTIGSSSPVVLPGKAPPANPATPTSNTQQTRYHLRSAGELQSMSSGASSPGTPQTRYNLRSSTKRADVADASSSVSSWSHLLPSGLAPPDFTRQQPPHSPQRAKDTESPLDPLSQPLASKMTALLEHSSRPGTQQVSVPSFNEKEGLQPQPLQQVKGLPSGRPDWKMSLSERLGHFRIEPFDAAKLRSLQSSERDRYVSTWHKITSKGLTGLKYFPAYASSQDGSNKAETAYEWRERFWRELSPSKRGELTRVVAELQQEAKGATARFANLIASELGAYIAITAFYPGVEFPKPDIRHPRYEHLDLDAIIGDPFADKLKQLNDCFEGEDQDLFNYHLFPMICEGLGTVSVEPAVQSMVDLLWQGLPQEKASTWKDGAWWLKSQLKHNDPLGLVKLLPCKPFDGSTDYHEMAEDLLLRWAKGEVQLVGETPEEDTELPSTGRSEQPSSTSSTLFPSIPEPGTPSTEEITSLMGKVSTPNQDDNLLQTRAARGLESSVWAH